MKKIGMILGALGIFALTFFLCPADMSVQAATILAPHVLTTGTDEDLAQASDDQFDADGTELYQLDVQYDGSIEMSMYARSAGYISVEVYQKPDGSDFPTYIAFACTADRNNYYTTYQYMQKGTYYLRFPKNSYRLKMLLFSSEARTIKNKSTVASYCDGTVSNVYTYKATGNGYITLDQKRLRQTAAPMSVSFYNAKGTKITDIISDHEIAKEIVFPVKKGTTYTIHIAAMTTNYQQYYQLKLTYTSLTEDSGAKKAKAVTKKLKSSIQGMVYAEDSTSTADWYKISNTDNKKLKLTYSGAVTSGSINLTLYNSKGKKVKTYNLLPGAGNGSTYNLTNTNGTFYLKVTKSQKETAGIYTIKVKAS